MLTKILYIMFFVAANILSYNVGYLQGLSDVLIEIKEEIRFDREVPIKGPAARAIQT